MLRVRAGAGAFLALVLMPLWRPAAEARERPPACATVEWIRGRADLHDVTGRTHRLCALSPVGPGDTIVVKDGRLGLCDLANGGRTTLGAGSVHVCPDPGPAPRKRGRLLQGLAKLFEKEREQVRTAGIRGEDGDWRPDSLIVSAGLPFRFEWPDGETPTSIVLETERGDHLELEAPAAATGDWPWPERLAAGEVRWSAITRSGARLGGGGFVVLSSGAADSLRRRFVRSARDSFPPGDRALGAVFLATRAGYRLW